MPFRKNRRFFSDGRTQATHTSTKQDTDSSKSTTQYLFVIKASTVTSYPLDRDSYILNIPISNSNTQIVAFTERPVRDAIVIHSQQLAELWGADSSFRKVPPNGVLDFTDPKTGERGSVVVEITDAKITSNNRILQLFVNQKYFERTDARLHGRIQPVMHCVSIFVDGDSSYGVGNNCGGPHGTSCNDGFGTALRAAGGVGTCHFPYINCSGSCPPNVCVQTNKCTPTCKQS